MKPKKRSTAASADGKNSRRVFIKNSATLAALAAAGPLINVSTLFAATKPGKDMINALQVGANSFVEEGVDNVLDILQNRGSINTIFLNTFTYGTGLASRMITGNPFPDHGPQEPDKNFHGGNYAIPHAKYYKNTVLKDTQSPEYGDRDIVAEVLKASKKRGMKVFATIEDQWRNDVPGIDECREIDLLGRKAVTLCLFNPNVREFWTALATDTCTSYDVDGIVVFNERNGPLLNALGASHIVTNIDPSKSTCFCNYHQQEAKKYNINFERAKEGYHKLDEFAKAALKDQRPSDGYYVEFQRIMLEYPEIVAWDKLFDIGKHQIVDDVYKAVKAIGKKQLVGLHIEHVNSFNPFFRATRDYENLAQRVDFLKVVMYNNVGGERYARFIHNIASTIFKDVPPEELMRFNNHLLGYSEKEAALDKLAMEGLSADYVFRETQRAIAGVKGKCPILPGIDIGIPVGKKSHQQTPDDVYNATLAAYKAGANGVILSRKYSEMKLEQIDAAGRAIREAMKG
ncbi:hypothetical protein [Mucilaginibacter sp.]|uniref:hypothetical protein n=1 Tax=Mucilaginibacter sp. TaxID=1882438 RepID=UPI00262213A4|nr:hypothetical protein [Mucilaginibacter sp.]MDB5031204.1 hypothetical protein [Mucilaginibacter sp.]